MRRRYDVIVVGARLAGTATAMQLARRGLDVLVVDRSKQGSDTLSTHALLRPGVELLERWGLRDRIRESGAPAVETTTFHYEGSEPLSFDVSDRPLLAPRRMIIDSILADAARSAGADVEYGCRVVRLIRSTRGAVVGVEIETATGMRAVTAPLIIGADGIGSRVARSVGAARTHVSRESSASIYAYFEGLAPDGYHWFFARHAAAGMIPTNDGLTCVFASTSSRTFAVEIKSNIEAGFSRLLAAAAPGSEPMWSDAKRVSRFRSFPGRRGFTRRAWGPGWALVGDAGAFTDPMSAHGMTAALRDSVLCADAAVAALDDPTCAGPAWLEYEATRDRLTVPFIDAIDDVAAFRHDMRHVQGAHVAMSAAAASESTELEARRWGRSVLADAGSARARAHPGSRRLVG